MKNYMDTLKKNSDLLTTSSSSDSSSSYSSAHVDHVDNRRFVLELSAKRIDFQPVSKDVSVFYDESNRQV